MTQSETLRFIKLNNDYKTVNKIGYINNIKATFGELIKM